MGQLGLSARRNDSQETYTPTHPDIVRIEFKMGSHASSLRAVRVCETIYPLNDSVF